jgi:transglutaminase-like putative cysteine protease
MIADVYEIGTLKQEISSYQLSAFSNLWSRGVTSEGEVARDANTYIITIHPYVLRNTFWNHSSFSLVTELSSCDWGKLVAQFCLIPDTDNKPDMLEEKNSPQRTPVDAIALFFFIVIITLPGLSIRSADWTDDLNTVTTIGIIGTLAGALLSWSTFGGRSVLLFNLVYWLFTLGWQMGTTMDPAMIWRDRILSLFGRLGAFSETILQAEKNRDPLMFVLIMGILIWFMGSFGAWTIFRKRGFWTAVLPPGIALIVNQIFYLGSADLGGYLIFYVRQQLWFKLRAQVAPNTILAFSRAGAIMAIVIVLLAWGGPAFAQSEQAAKLWGVVTLPFREIRDKLSDAFGGLRGSVGVSYDIYGENLLLDAGTEPADITVMHITAEDKPEKGGRFYWFSRAYDTYEFGSWKVTIGSVVEFDPEIGDLPIPQYDARQTIEVEVAPKVSSMHGLYAPAQPLWTNRSGEIDLYRIPGGGVDVLRMTTHGVVRDGETYRARSSVAIPGARQLREASQEYPAWVTANYLQLPANITERTLELAKEITEGIDNSFDKATTITQWLRSNIDYERVTISPPEDVEQIDWFLFDYQIGFCNWYASSEVILLRSLGIPARMAVGYARGNLQAFEGYYEVKGGDAHAWPEVFFPEYGWVEFEPTGNQSELNRPEEVEPVDGLGEGGVDLGRELDQGQGIDPDADLLDLLAKDEFALAEQVDVGSILSWVLFSLVLITIVVFAWFRFDPVSRVIAIKAVMGGIERIGIRPPEMFQPVYQYDLTPIGRVYSRWSVWIGRLGVSLNLAQTPYERATTFGSKYPAASKSGWHIVKSYVQERFSSDQSEADELKDIWRELRPYLWIEWMRKKLGLGDRSG